MFWNNPSGGLYHHLRALRFGREWQPFRAGLHAWLTHWRPQRATLVLVGPSGGYCLPLPALQQFERFVVFEVDPVARLVLRRRFAQTLPGRPVEWIERDMWVDPLRHGGQLPRARIDSDSALLFTNIIGQLPYLLEPDAYPAWRQAWCAQLFPWLEHMPWASFHDRVSSDVPPFEALPAHTKRLDELEVSALYASDPTRDRVELSEHGSHELLPPGNDYTYLHWPLNHHRHHLIECVLGGPSGE